MIDNVCLFDGEAVAERVRNSVFKIHQIIKFAMFCLFDMNMAGIFMKQGQYLIELTSMMAHGVDQFFQKTVVCPVAVDIFISFRR